MNYFDASFNEKTKITNDKTITEQGKYVLDAYQNNPTKPNTLAYNVARKLDVVDGAAAHNTYYKEVNLLSMFTLNEIFSRIADGTFRDLPIGGYFDITIHTEYTPTEIVRCVMGMFDPFLNCGDIPKTKHHALIVPKNCFTATHQMNTTNTTAGGYRGTVISTVLGKYADAISDAIGSSHLIPHRSLLTKSISETGTSMAGAGLIGYSNGWDWYDVRLQLLSEIQACGSNVCSSSFYDTGIDNLQLPLFSLNPAALVCKAGGVDDVNSSNRVWWWLKNVASATDFCGVDNYGYSSCSRVSYSRGLRPFWCIG